MYFEQQTEIIFFSFWPCFSMFFPSQTEKEEKVQKLRKIHLFFSAFLLFISHPVCDAKRHNKGKSAKKMISNSEWWATLLKIYKIHHSNEWPKQSKQFSQTK